MLRFITFLALFGCAFAGTIIGPRPLDGRIAGGEETTIEEHPYAVSIQSYTTGRHVCGGSLYKKDIVITAAQCVRGWAAINLYVRMGATNHSSEEDGVDVDVDTFIVHPGYNPYTFVNDVAVIKLLRPVAQTAQIQYIKLADYTPEQDVEAVVTGWGATCDYWCIPAVYMLRKADVNIIDWQTCSSNQYSYGTLVQDNMLCAAARGKDACFGDSGGSLVADGKLVGIISWGNGCAERSYPGVYVDVSVYKEWIERAASGLSMDTLKQ